MTTPAVLRADDPRRSLLEGQGWTVIARSWAAQLDADRADRGRLYELAMRARVEGVAARELAEEDVAAILDLDAATAHDYPGGVATSHAPLTAASASPTVHRRAFGVVESGGELIAMSFVDLEGPMAEIDFTVVAAPWRGRGLGAGLKAATVLALIEDGVESIRTGGSADNAAIVRANLAIGFVIDEHWITLAAPSRE